MLLNLNGHYILLTGDGERVLLVPLDTFAVDSDAAEGELIEGEGHRTKLATQSMADGRLISHSERIRGLNGGSDRASLEVASLKLAPVGRFLNFLY